MSLIFFSYQPAAQMSEQMLLFVSPTMQLEYKNSDYDVISDENFPVIAVFPEQLQPHFSHINLHENKAASPIRTPSRSTPLIPSRFSPSSSSFSTSYETVYIEEKEGVGDSFSETGAGDGELAVNQRRQAVAWIRYINRLALVSITVVCALSVPCFSSVIAFLGSCTVSVLTYIMPPLLHARLVSKPRLAGALVSHTNSSNNMSNSSENSTIGASLHSLSISVDYTYLLTRTQLALDRLYFLVGIVFCLISTFQTGRTIFLELIGEQSCNTIGT
jgi:amino acid permease